MNSSQARNAYRQSEAQSKIHPVKLIHLMYERTLIHLDMALIGIENKSPQLKGENLGKAIAIITELNASVKDDDDSEAALFLRGLYNAILVELPKAAVNNDAQVVRQTSSYIRRLKEIWEETAMAELESKEKGKQEPYGRSTGEVLREVEPKVAAPGGLSFSI
ncbi:MAG: flagellar export chaperone FliS [Pseudomonadota bacterium]